MNSSASTTPLKQYLLVFAGAILGGALGTTLTWYLSSQGMRAGAAPGGLLGMGAGLIWHRSWVIPVICCVAALAIGIGVEWWLHPFLADASLLFFLQHLADLPFSTQLMILIGGAVGFYGPFRAMSRAPIRAGAQSNI